MDSVVLRSELWDRLVGIAGSAPSWVHGCALGDEHPDLHHTAVGYRGGHLWWLRWFDGDDAELVALTPCPNTRCMLFDGHDGAHRGHEPTPTPASAAPAGLRSPAEEPAPMRATHAMPLQDVRGEATVNGAVPDGQAAGAARRQGLSSPAGISDAPEQSRADDLGEIARALWALVGAVDRLADTRADTPPEDRFPRRSGPAGP